MRMRALLIAATLSVATAAPALAQPSAADLELAKRHFELGRTYYDQAAYDKALTAFEESYNLSKKAALLFNIGKCYEALGKLEQAIEHYERYLKATDTSDPNLAARIENLRKRVAAARPQPAPEPTPTPAPEPTPPAEPAQPEQPAPDPAQPARWMTWTGWTLVGVGGASIVTSIVLGVFAQRKADAVERYWADKERDWAEVSVFEDEGKALQTGQIVTMIAGIAIAGGGVAMLLLAPKHESRRVTLTPQIGPGLVGVGGRWSF